MTNISNSLVGFNNEVKRYIAEIEKTYKGREFLTPPKKQNDEHFRWLIDYQIPPIKSYAELARENSLTNKTIRQGIESVIELIGLKLRPAKRTGRTVGIKETQTRRREG